jgi:hypothetical protein
MTASGQEPHHDELGRFTCSVTKRDDLAVSLGLAAISQIEDDAKLTPAVTMI